ncbi:MAG: PHP domain-containing protein, partial [Bacilli bacterium]|nr:PHP domain-containing protein [Bacilli bacterium]
MNNFVPLRVVSCYSFLQSGLTIERIATGVNKNTYFGVGLCDKGVLYGVPSFIKEMEVLGKPTIIGLEVNLDNDTLGLYAINEDGYRHLLKISTAIQKQEFNRKFLENHSEGLLAIIVTSSGAFKGLFLEKNEGFARYLLNWNNMFRSGFYLGVEVTKKEDVKYANEIRKFASEHSYETVAFPQIRYLKKDDAIVLRIAEAIANEESIKEKKAIGQEYFMSITDYQKIYTPREILNTQKVLEKSSFDFHQKRGELF